MSVFIELVFNNKILNNYNKRELILPKTNKTNLKCSKLTSRKTLISLKKIQKLKDNLQPLKLKSKLKMNPQKKVMNVMKKLSQGALLCPSNMLSRNRIPVKYQSL